MTEKEQRILEIQQPSTRACLTRPKDLDLEWLNRKIPKEAQVRDEEGNVFLNMRALTFEETRMEEGIRRARGGWLAQMRNEPHLSSVTEEKKHSAIHSFMTIFSVERIKDKFKELMGGLKKELSHAEKVAAAMRDVMNEK